MELFSVDGGLKHLSVEQKLDMATLKLLETSHLEQWVLACNGRTFGRNITWVSKQDIATDVRRSDLVGIDDRGRVVVCELKRGTATRDVITQSLAYAANYRDYDLASLSELLLRQIAKNHLVVPDVTDDESAQDYLSASVFQSTSGEETGLAVNDSQLIIVAAEFFDYETLVIADYLNQAVESGAFVIELWKYELFKHTSDLPMVAFTQLLPPPSLQDEIEQRRDAKQNNKYARDPAKKQLAIRLAEILGSLDGWHVVRGKGATYRLDLTRESTGNSYVVTTQLGQPSVNVPDASGELLGDGTDLFDKPGSLILENGRARLAEFSSTDVKAAPQIAERVRKLVETIDRASAEEPDE